ncbi:MAG: GNAT family N-acetyltransferase [Myxococcales bacterium]|nr:GNAT family N-acetyltransferase [Myxococcales bacterium]
MNTHEEPGALPTDAVRVRTITEADLTRVVAIDKKSMGRPREEYFRSRLKSALSDSKMVTSLVAEVDGLVVGFVISRLYYGEFGRTEPVAVLDSIGVDPEFRKQHVGAALLRQLTMNLKALNVERLETDVEWNHFELLSFLARSGFKPAARVCLSLAL